MIKLKVYLDEILNEAFLIKLLIKNINKISINAIEKRMPKRKIKNKKILD